MEALDADMDDLFGADEAIEDNRYNDDKTTRGSSTVENDDKAAKDKVKRIITRKPQPRLNADRLISDKGILKLHASFKDVQLKGKGHEAEDLDVVMKTIEHWGHRMFPQLPFNDLLQKVEKLGSKRAVQVCVQKMRLDMPFADEDFVGDNDKGDDNVQREGDEASFDNLLSEHSSDVAIDNKSTSVTVKKSTSTYTDLTDEQKERITRNKMLAEERRMARLNAANQRASNIATAVVDVTDSESKDQELHEQELMDMLDVEMES